MRFWLLKMMLKIGDTAPLSNRRFGYLLPECDLPYILLPIIVSLIIPNPEMIAMGTTSWKNRAFPTAQTRIIVFRFEKKLLLKKKKNIYLPLQYMATGQRGALLVHVHWLVVEANRVDCGPVITPLRHTEETTALGRAKKYALAMKCHAQVIQMCSNTLVQKNII